jgi:hypothetical protein
MIFLNNIEIIKIKHDKELENMRLISIQQEPVPQTYLSIPYKASTKPIRKRVINKDKGRLDISKFEFVWKPIIPTPSKVPEITENTEQAEKEPEINQPTDKTGEKDTSKSKNKSAEEHNLTKKSNKKSKKSSSESSDSE